MKLVIKPCPCGRCKNVIVAPLFVSQDASITPDYAKDLVDKYNAFDELTAKVEEQEKIIRSLLDRLQFLEDIPF